MRYALIEEATGRVVNVIEWDGDRATWQPREGLRTEPAAGDVSIDDVHDGDKFTRPAPEDRPRQKDRLDRVLDALVARGVLTRGQADAL